MASPYLSVYCGHESLVESEKYMKFSSELFEEDMLLLLISQNLCFRRLIYEKAEDSFDFYEIS